MWSANWEYLNLFTRVFFKLQIKFLMVKLMFKNILILSNVIYLNFMLLLFYVEVKKVIRCIFSLYSNMWVMEQNNSFIEKKKIRFNFFVKLIFKLVHLLSHRTHVIKNIFFFEI